MIEPNKNDKRPIAKFYRCWQEDMANGVALEKCRGINQGQYRAADRLATNYQRAFLNGGKSLVKATKEKIHYKSFKIETQLQAMHNHQQIFKQLNKKSQEIIEHFCLHELPMRQFELKQIPQWPKGVGTARLRGALDDLVEIYRQLPSEIARRRA